MQSLNLQLFTFTHTSQFPSSIHPDMNCVKESPLAPTLVTLTTVGIRSINLAEDAYSSVLEVLARLRIEEDIQVGKLI